MRSAANILTAASVARFVTRRIEIGLSDDGAGGAAGAEKQHVEDFSRHALLAAMSGNPLFAHLCRADELTGVARRLPWHAAGRSSALTRLAAWQLLVGHLGLDDKSAGARGRYRFQISLHRLPVQVIDFIRPIIRCGNCVLARCHVAGPFSDGILGFR